MATHWRTNYDVDFIIPRLLWPVASSLPRNYLEAVEDQRKVIMDDLFYNFVGDRDPKIPRNLLVRFYERITPFWFMLIVDPLTLLASGGALIYGLAHPDAGTGVLWFAAICILLNLLARLAAGHFLAETRQATLDELRAIHASCMDELEEGIEKLAGG